MKKLEYLIDLGEFLRTHVDELISDDEDLSNFNELYGSYAISKAEDSTLTLLEAQETARLDFWALSQYGYTIAQQVHALDPSSKTYQKKLKKLHDRLEFLNILQVFRTINASEHIQSQRLCTVERLCEIHEWLTKDLDELFDGKLQWYEPYHSWQLRAKDNISIRKYYPIKADIMPAVLQDACREANSLTSIDEIFSLHAFMYHIHPFSNGNKRICRIVELILLRKLWVDTSVVPPSLWYYRQQERYIKRLLETSLKRKDYVRFVPFAWGSLILGVLYVLHREIRRRRSKILNGYEWLRILATLREGERVSTKRLQDHKDLKRIPRRTFYEILERELEQVGDIIKREKQGRNVYYSLSLQDSTYQALVAKFRELLDIYKDENMWYQKISFLKWW